jgi:tetratricopeptide (TPR) repeat protein
MDSRSDARIEFPPPRPGISTEESDVVFEDFAGSESCEECHEEQYEAWLGSTHGRAGGAPGPDVIIAQFDGNPIRFADAVVTPWINGRGDYLFTVEQEYRDPVEFRVDGVIGGGHMVGGGTQGFVSLYPDGTVRFLPFDFIRQEGVWFCNTNTRTDEGWIPVTEEMRLADCGDWPPLRVLGTDAQWGNCQECHGSQILLEFDPQARRYDTKIMSLTVNCESCHGPGKRHVELADAEQLDDTEDMAIQVLTTLSKDASLEVCFRCHAVKDMIEPGYLPGHELEKHYSLKSSLVGFENPFFADGRIRTFAYQQNHLYSDCYLSGSMTCVDCHDPHTGEYWDIYGRVLESRFSDGQCLDCHPSKADDVQRHTFHEPDSEGSVCVACHMPYLQHPLLGNELRFARSDHTIPIPRPAFDNQLGVMDACSPCHEDMTLDSLERATKEWWGELKPHKDIIAGLVEAQQGGRRAADIPLQQEPPHSIGQVAALNHLLEEYLRPNMAHLEPTIVASLRELAQSSDLDVQSISLAALHLARGEDLEVRKFLAEQLESLGDRDGDVRKRWAVALGYFGDQYRSRGEVTAAIVVYNKALEVLPQRASILHNLAQAFRLVRDYNRAVEYYQRSLAVDPNQPLAYVNLGVALEAQARDEEAITAYRNALALNANEALAHFNLGNIYLRRNEYRQAIGEYRLAVSADPGLGRAHYYLARSHFMVGELDNALAAVRYAVEFDPNNTGAQQMLRELESVVDGGDRP